MQELTKSNIYKKLNELKSKNIEVSPYIAKMVGVNYIPYEVIVFINAHTPLVQFRTYNEIYNKRRKSALFRNIVNVDLPVSEQVIVLSSLLNQSLISLKHSDEEDKDTLIDMMNVHKIIEALSCYIYEGDTQCVVETFQMFQQIFKTLFPRK